MPIDERWREQARSAQEAALPPGRVVLSCPAPLDSGGLGRHLRELLDALERSGEPHFCISTGSHRTRNGAEARADMAAYERPGVAAGAGLTLTPGALAWGARPLARVSRAWRMWAQNADFDRAAARRLPAGDHLLAFNGAAISQFRTARRAGWESISLVSANSHFRHVVRQHAIAHERYPIERPWVSHLVRRNLAEYGRAQRIYVASEYVRESFLREGHDASALARFPLTPHPRYRPSHAPRTSSTFDILYIGSLTVHKGVPLLVDALRRVPNDDIRLVLIGGWSTRAMRRFLQRACARDARISIASGDPLPALQHARLCVHPAYEDGFAYAPAEALACGVPVIVSEDTGMKELVEPGRTGLLTPTGDLAALSEAIAAAYRGELFRG